MKPLTLFTNPCPSLGSAISQEVTGLPGFTATGPQAPLLRPDPFFVLPTYPRRGLVTGEGRSKVYLVPRNKDDLSWGDHRALRQRVRKLGAKKRRPPEHPFPGSPRHFRVGGVERGGKVPPRGPPNTRGAGVGPGPRRASLSLLRAHPPAPSDRRTHG